MLGQRPARVGPQWEPGQGQEVALATWALQSPPLLWISYLPLGPLPLPQLLLPLHLSVVNKGKRVRYLQKLFFNGGQKSQARRSWATMIGDRVGGAAL